MTPGDGILAQNPRAVADCVRLLMAKFKGRAEFDMIEARNGIIYHQSQCVYMAPFGARANPTMGWWTDLIT